MITWRTREFYGRYVVEECDDGKVLRHVVNCGKDAALARRIARLPKLEKLHKAVEAAREEVGP